MSRTIMIMAVATGLGDFGSGVTRAQRALAYAEMQAATVIKGSQS